MNEKRKSIWTRPFQGRVKILIGFGLLAIVVFCSLLLASAISNRENLWLLVPVALIFAALLLGLMSFIRWLFHWRNFKRFLFGVACFITLVVLVLSEENWRGRRAWENYKSEWEAKGEKFTLPKLAPPSVPDDQNFAMTPLFKPIYEYVPTPNGAQWRDTNGLQRLRQISADLPPRRGESDKLELGNLERGTFADLEACRKFYRGNTNYPQPTKSGTAARDILTALGKFDPELKELHEAAISRPYSRFPIHYDQAPAWGILLPHLANMKGISIVIDLRGTARLAAGQTDAAFDDLKLGFRMSDSISNEPLLIDHLVRLATLNITLQVVREGLVRHAWSDSQLAELEKYLASLNLLAEYKLAMRGERACNIEGLDYLRTHRSYVREMLYMGEDGGAQRAQTRLLSLVPSSLFYRNMLVISQMHQKFTIPAADAKARRINLDIVHKGGEAIAELGKEGFNPYKIFARMLFPAVTKAVMRTGLSQSFVDEARVACALERYRLQNDRLPDTLEALVPQFIDRIPNDVIDGQPLRYHKTEDGGYVIYSIGWNESDDGGTVALEGGSTPRADMNKGDWVWQMPGRN